MKFPKKLRVIALAFALCGLVTSISAFATQPNTGGGNHTAAPAAPGLPPGAQGLPNYYIAAANLDNPAYIACIRANASKPGPNNIEPDLNSLLANCAVSRN